MSEVKERISVSTFVERYSKLTNQQLKDKYVKEHIKTTYSPILMKKIILETMNDKSVVDGSVKYIDLVISKLNLVMAILVLYTDIEPDKDEEGKPLTWESYDKLKSTGLIGMILEFVGEEEINELMSVQKSVMDTWTMKNTSPESYIANLVEIVSNRFGVVAGAGMEKLATVLDDEVKMKKIATAFDKVMKKIK